MSTKYCHSCAEIIDDRADFCPKCGAQQHLGQDEYGHGGYLDPNGPELRKAGSDKIAAGICGILLGALGVHKFILGMTTPGVIMLVITIGTCGIGSIATSIIGAIEGVIYLTRTDEEFYETYVVGQKQWF